MLISRNGPSHSNKTKQLKGAIVVDTSMFFYDNNNKTPSVSSKIKVATQIDQTQEMIGQLTLIYLW